MDYNLESDEWKQLPPRPFEDEAYRELEDFQARWNDRYAFDHMTEDSEVSINIESEWHEMVDYVRKEKYGDGL